MNIINKCTIASAMGAVICTSASGLASETIFEQNTGGEVSNSGFDFSTSTWASMEVTRLQVPTDQTLPLHSTSSIHSQAQEMSPCTSSPVMAQQANSAMGSAAFASQTVTTADLGSNAMNGSAVTWDFSGITIPDNIVIALEVADSDGTGASIFASVFGSSSGSSPIIGSNFGYNRISTQQWLHLVL